MEENANKFHFQSPLFYSSTNSDILVIKIASPATAAGNPRVHCTRPFAAKRSRLKPGRLPSLGSHAGTSLQDCTA